MPPKPECKQRKEDTLKYKLTMVAAILAAIAGISTFTVKLFALEFVTKTDMNTTELRINKVESDVTSINSKIDYIYSDVKDIKQLLMERK